MDSHKKGDLTEAAVLTELKRRDVPVSIPFGDNERYDFVVETPDTQFLRAQIKTGWSRDGVIKSKENTRAFRRGMNPTLWPPIHRRHSSQIFNARSLVLILTFS